MTIADLRRRADRHSSEASRSRQEFCDHAERSVKITRHLLATPLGLSACFGFGALVGTTTSTRHRGKAGEDSRPRSRTRSMLADTTTRIASALIVGALMNTGENAGAEAPTEGA